METGLAPDLDEPTRRQYLEAMGITLWLPRDAASGLDAVPAGVQASACASPAVIPVAAQPPPVAGSVDTAQRAAPTQQATAANRPQPPVATKPTPPPVGRPSTDDAPSMPTPPSWLTDVPPLDDGLIPDFDEDAFHFDAPEPAPNPVASLDWPGLAGHVAACKGCGLHATRTQTVLGVGDRQAKLMIIGEAPGEEEDRRGEPFVGRAGQLLDAMLAAIGLKREQVYIANILKCRPPGNRTPAPEEARACEAYLMRQIALIQPRMILAAGAVAAQNLLKTENSVTSLRGKWHRLGAQQTPLLVTYHPAYLLRKPVDKAKAWEDLQRIAAALKRVMQGG